MSMFQGQGGGRQGGGFVPHGGGGFGFGGRPPAPSNGSQYNMPQPAGGGFGGGSGSLMQTLMGGRGQRPQSAPYTGTGLSASGQHPWQGQPAPAPAAINPADYPAGGGPSNYGTTGVGSSIPHAYNGTVFVDPNGSANSNQTPQEWTNYMAAANAGLNPPTPASWNIQTGPVDTTGPLGTRPPAFRR